MIVTYAIAGALTGALAFILWLLYRTPKQVHKPTSTAVAAPFQVDRQAELTGMQRRVRERRSARATAGLPTAQAATGNPKDSPTPETADGGEFGDDLAAGLAISQQDAPSDESKRRTRKFGAMEADAARLKELYKQNNSIPK